MAIAMLFLIPLLIGIIDVGRLIYSHIALQEAAQEGALLASFEENVSVGDITNRVITSTSFPTIQPGEIAVSCGPDASPRPVPGRVVGVTVTHEQDLLLPFTGTAIIAKTVSTDRFFDSCP